MLTELLRELACVDARYSRHLFTFQPVGERFAGIPMTVFLTVV